MLTRVNINAIIIYDANIYIKYEVAYESVIARFITRWNYKVWSR